MPSHQLKLNGMQWLACDECHFTLSAQFLFFKTKHAAATGGDDKWKKETGVGNFFEIKPFGGGHGQEKNFSILICR
jgi:hypothetical protein